MAISKHANKDNAIYDLSREHGMPPRFTYRKLRMGGDGRIFDGSHVRTRESPAQKMYIDVQMQAKVLHEALEKWGKRF